MGYRGIKNLSNSEKSIGRFFCYGVFKNTIEYIIKCKKCGNKVLDKNVSIYL